MFSLSKTSPIPLHTQLLNELRHAILSGKLKPHEQLPGEYALINQLQHQPLDDPARLADRPGRGSDLPRPG